ncbi:MAG TPA: hypothetical protein VFE10_13375 [Phenylobacterium sp.]|jgi:hypothetical protein|nr:hypothetical protein [Phenylobacterium sp.]
MSSPPDAPQPDPDRFAQPILLGRKRQGLLFARLQTAGIVILLTAIASIPISVGVGTWAAHRASLREWLVRGPACPQSMSLSPAARGAKPPAPFVFQGIGFAYQIGDAFCAVVPVENVFSQATFPVCNFDAPAAVAVTTGRRTVLFEPGVGHSATVSIRHGRVSCVIGAGFRD